MIGIALNHEWMKQSEIKINEKRLYLFNNKIVFPLVLHALNVYLFAK